jgi:hypothetical protein
MSARISRRAALGALVVTGAVALSARTVISQDAAQDYAKEWKRLATPGDGHKRLDPLVGTWSVSTPVLPDAGTLTAKWILGGRFVQLDADGGAAYTGLCLIGYDNAAAKYVSASLNTNQTFLSSMTGSFDGDGKTLTFTTEMMDPVLKCPCTVRSVITLASADEFRWEVSVDYKNDKPAVKTHDGTYKRKK